MEDTELENHSDKHFLDRFREKTLKKLEPTSRLTLVSYLWSQNCKPLLSVASIHSLFTLHKSQHAICFDSLSAEIEENDAEEK